MEVYKPLRNAQMLEKALVFMEVCKRPFLHTSATTLFCNGFLVFDCFCQPGQKPLKIKGFSIGIDWHISPINAHGNPFDFQWFSPHSVREHPPFEWETITSKKQIDHGRTRTCNLRLRRATPYPLGHAAIEGERQCHSAMNDHPARAPSQKTRQKWSWRVSIPLPLAC